jgi:hypothetical protein
VTTALLMETDVAAITAMLGVLKAGLQRVLAANLRRPPERRRPVSIRRAGARAGVGRSLDRRGEDKRVLLDAVRVQACHGRPGSGCHPSQPAAGPPVGRVRAPRSRGALSPALSSLLRTAFTGWPRTRRGCSERSVST